MGRQVFVRRYISGRDGWLDPCPVSRAGMGAGRLGAKAGLMGKNAAESGFFLWAHHSPVGTTKDSCESSLPNTMIPHWLGAGRPPVFMPSSLGRAGLFRSGGSDMSERFTSALLAALNESTEFKDNGWNSIEEVLRGQSPSTDFGPSQPQGSENRFAAVVSSGMAKIRAGE
jgi:hypothetical protein